MNLIEMLSKNSFIIDFKPSSKKHLLEELSILAEKELKISSRTILENLTKREKLGSTAIGNGVALPHASHINVNQPKGFIAILSSGIDFNANDDQLVDIVFLLICSSKNGYEHLQTLASVSRLLKNNELIMKLRGCKNTESALAVISQSLRDQAA